MGLLMNYIDGVIEKLKYESKRKIVLPESEDERVIEAANKAVEFADIYLIGDESIKNKLDERVNVINPLK